jgi:hypothetical protein
MMVGVESVGRVEEWRSRRRVLVEEVVVGWDAYCKVRDWICLLFARGKSSRLTNPLVALMALPVEPMVCMHADACTNTMVECAPKSKCILSSFYLNFTMRIIWCTCASPGLMDLGGCAVL